ncbi:ParB/Srx family N-terminal domain-containing protein [Rhodococcus sp. NPDC058521]|uniref:ParB/Srx family N-terminal domain-containing protein n=1 Tax=Rhodococcus sp. NPDC058521 TaxID=3346536 RepID=UPI003658888E
MSSARAASLILTDGHHTLTSFFETPDGGPNMHVRLRVVANLADLDDARFWSEMENRKWVWNRDVDGNTVPVEQLPSGVGLSQFADDKYRSAVYFGRDVGFESGSTEFQEFYWGAWLRDSGAVDLGAWDSNDRDSYLKTVEQVTRAQVELPRDQVVDSGRTAADLGALQEWNGGKSADKGEFDKLSKPYTDDKPGKIAYAMEYKNGL